jgi:hypothetical protein
MYLTKLKIDHLNTFIQYIKKFKHFFFKACVYFVLGFVGITEGLGEHKIGNLWSLKKFGWGSNFKVTSTHYKMIVWCNLWLNGQN